MSAYRSILVHVGSDPRTRIRLQLACRLAADHGARVTALYVHPPLVIPSPFAHRGVAEGSELFEVQRRHSEELAHEAAREFEAVCAKRGLEHAWLTTHADHRGGAIATEARLHDLVVVGQSERLDAHVLARQVPERVVLESGRPTLMVPYAGAFPRLGERILIAWNATREAARAVTDALPLLLRAREVLVFEIDPPETHKGSGVALAAHLKRHGVETEARHTLSAGIAAGEILLSALADFGSDCLVMGAYGHSRARELALGGVTRTVLEEMTVPVLMSY